MRNSNIHREKQSSEEGIHTGKTKTFIFLTTDIADNLLKILTLNTLYTSIDKSEMTAVKRGIKEKD